MPDMPLVFVIRSLAAAIRHWGLGGLAVLGTIGLAGCPSQPEPTSTIDLQLYQVWELQPGDRLKGFEVTGGLGDTSIALNGKPAYAPFDGKTQIDKRQCLIFSSPNVPAYLFRLCGLANPRLGSVSQGEILGYAAVLQFATLRRQPNGTWAIVEPSKPILERTVAKS